MITTNIEWTAADQRRADSFEQQILEVRTRQPKRNRVDVILVELEHLFAINSPASVERRYDPAIGPTDCP